jgi:2,3-bisphosphoglycerate-dependent phosphoglycerate mutase
MALNAEIYLLRHATVEEESDLPNLDIPLSKVGERQANSLVDYLSSLNFDAIYTSPYRRARNTVLPLCENMGIVAKVRKGLGESAKDEELSEVGKRLTKVIHAIGREHPGGRILACTHGGCMWGLIASFDESFGEKEYSKIKSPDVRRIVYTAGKPKLMDQLTF